METSLFLRGPPLSTNPLISEQLFHDLPLCPNFKNETPPAQANFSGGGGGNYVFDGVFLRYNLPKKTKDGAYVINLDEYADVGTHWIALFCNRNETVYFDSSGVEHFPEQIKKFIDRPSSTAEQNKSIKADVFRGQENESIMCGYFCIGFIDFMLAGKKSTDYTDLFSPYDFKKSDDIILSYFKNE